MDQTKVIDTLPCGYLAFDDNGNILTANQTLLTLLNYEKDELNENHIDVLLSPSARLFYQLYFFPMIKVQKKIEEMYISLMAKDGTEIPVLLNASRNTNDTTIINECIFVPMYKRNEFEEELIKARKEAERAYAEKNAANERLEEKHQELVKLLSENQRFQAKIQQELELAKKIQAVSLSLPLNNEHLQSTTFYKPSSELSGDIFAIYQINTYQYGVIIIDVMGHGISSALVSISLRSLYQTFTSQGASVETTIKELDQYLHSLFENNEDIMHYATTIHLHIDTEKREIQYINAGHPPAVLIENEELIFLNSTSPPIGLFPGIEFNVSKISYQKNTRLFLYTDGITDLLAMEQLSEILKNHKKGHPAVLKEEIVKLVEEKEATVDESDDQSFIILDL